MLKAFATLCAVLVGACPLAAQDLSVQIRDQVVSGATELLRDRYVDPEMGGKLADTLPAAAQKWTNISDPQAFADAMTGWLREVSGDGHLGLSYSVTPIADAAKGEGATIGDSFEKWYGKGVNHGVEKIERLPDNITLLDLRAFPPPAMGADVISAAMTVAAQGDALIIDLRNNGGGADTVGLILGYLLEPGSPMMSHFNRPENKWTHYSVPSWVPGRRFGEEKPVYVLIAKNTFSAAEAFAYCLQAADRATIIGETSGGGAHPFEYRKVSGHFALDLPEWRSVHPLTGTNWQGVGVKPDVETPSAAALDKALDLARQQITNRLSASRREVVIEFVNKDLRIIDKLGIRIKAGAKLTMTDLPNSNGSEAARMSFDLVGRKGTAKVDGVIKRVNGVWTPEDMTVTFSDGSTIPLSVPVEAQEQPAK